MSFNKIWVVTCDYAGCGKESIGLPVPSRDQSLSLAFSAGFGRMQIGKFSQWIYICQEHRLKLQQEDSPEEFIREIKNKDHTDDHTILLSCGHEFTRVDLATPDTAECSACKLKWLKSGEIIGVPNLNDLIREIP